LYYTASGIITSHSVGGRPVHRLRESHEWAAVPIDGPIVLSPLMKSA